MTYHISTQSLDVSSIIVISGYQIKRLILSGVEARILVLSVVCDRLHTL
jgi:hypothetical protein